MAIAYQCVCGSHIRLPDAAAGKRARCKACGVVFTVPAGVRQALTKEEPKPSFLRRLYEGVPPDLGDETADENPSAEPTEPDRRGFWADLVASFWFFVKPGNLASFFVIVFINLWNLLLGFAGIFGFIGSIILNGYLCAFYLATILETASGEDDLPRVWINNLWDDLLMPLFQFIGTFLWVLLPAIGLSVAMYYTKGEVDWKWVKILAVIGLLHWPVVILAVAIGGGFNGIWPHTVIRTALAAPAAYAAVCVAVLISYGLMILPDTPLMQSTIARLVPAAGWAIPIIGAVSGAFAMIVTMRVIGLFYRHYKNRFPWAAE